MAGYPAIEMCDYFPVINVGNKQSPCYLPVEACQVLPGQVSGAKLSSDQTRTLISFACREPLDNADSIVGAGRRVLSLDPPRNAALMKNGLTVLPELITVEARVLKPPPLKYFANKTVHTVNGSWNLADKVQFHLGAKIGKWTYMWIKTKREKPNDFVDFENETTLLKIVEKFISVVKSSGVSLTKESLLVRREQKPIVEISNNPHDAAHNNALVLKGLQDLYRNENNPDMPRLILVILPYNDAGIYGTIKNYCDITAGIHTVCVVGSKFAKGQPTYFANVAMKINLKFGGTNQVLDGPKLGIINDGKTMVVGIDVTHPSPQSEDTAPSVAGVVASIDKSLGQWPCALRHQLGRTEMVADLEEMFRSRLLVWQKRHKAFPINILIYRDGVSEGQYQAVLNNELPLLRNACVKLYRPKEQPAITLIIVGKRHHVRFYPTKDNEADKISHNCKNGTVVDRGVTEVRPWHFYLQAHACIKGTARSAHYYVLVDDIFRTKAKKNTDPNQKNAADALEQLTHNLCYLFGRATKAVSICPPAYHADLLCERSRLYLSRLFDPSTPTATPALSATGPPVAGPSSAGQIGTAPPVSGATRAAEYAIHPRLRDSMFYI
jgi:eukaryotic translation initiation factor 2C